MINQWQAFKRGGPGIGTEREARWLRGNSVCNNKLRHGMGARMYVEKSIAALHKYLVTRDIKCGVWATKCSGGARGIADSGGENNEMSCLDKMESLVGMQQR